MSAAKNWLLIAPEWESLDTIWKQPRPFILWPVCGKPLLAYWLDEALRAGAGTIAVLEFERPHLVRAWLDKGDYWSREVRVISREGGETWEERRTMDALPGGEPPAAVRDGRELLERWFELHVEALRLREGIGLSIDRELAPGVWAGPGAVVHPDAELTAPCWIGPQTRVGARCKLGPNVFVSKRAVIDDDVSAKDAIVCANTYVGRHTDLEMSAAQGGLLVNWKLGVAVRIVEDFILADLSPRVNQPGWGERLLAAILKVVVAGPARLWNWGRTPVEKTILSGDGRSFAVKTWPCGPLVIRREPWLDSVIAGRLKLFGILPRSEADWQLIPAEIRSDLEGAGAGVFALSDLYNCHDPAEPDEWMHATYQAGAADGSGLKQTRRSAFRIALKNPLT